jgi:hypothetical protein
MITQEIDILIQIIVYFNNGNIILSNKDIFSENIIISS